MSILGIVESALKAIEIIDKYIDSPEARTKARREYIDYLDQLRKKAVEEKDIEKLDEIVTAIIAVVHSK